MVNGPLWCPMMSVSLFFRLIMGVGNVGENGYRMNPDAMRFWLRRNVSVMVSGCISIHGVGNLIVFDENLN